MNNLDEIRRDRENALRGTKPEIINQIPMRVPPEERLPGVITTEKEGTSK
jgi:hypothetical protein